MVCRKQEFAIYAALSAAYARGLRDAREIVGDLPLNNEDGVIVNDMKIERDCEAIRAIDARLSAIPDATKTEGME